MMSQWDSQTTNEEMTEILDVFKNDMEDSQFEAAKSRILNEGSLVSSAFDRAVSSGDQNRVIKFFIALGLMD